MKTQVEPCTARCGLISRVLVAVVGWVVVFGTLAAEAQTAGWSRFRGPNGTGTVDAAELPVEFDQSDFKWTTTLPGSGHSSPVLWEGRIFLTAQHESEDRRFVVCVDATDGKILWKWEDQFEPYDSHGLNSFAASTPALDAKRVYVTWVSGDQFIVLALDHEGKELWQRRMDDFSSRFGAGASPAIVDDLVLVGNDHAGTTSFLIGLDAATGETRWKTKRRSGYTSFITPTLYQPDEGPVQAIFISPEHGITSVDPHTGKVNWEVDARFTLKTVASPVIADGVVIASAGRGGGGQESVAVRLPKSASDQPEVLYRLRSGLPYVPTPVALGKYFFLVNDGGVATCVEAATGEVVWQERLGGSYFASPIRVGKRICCVSREGDVAVLEAGPEFRVLGRSKLPEGSHATPAVADGCIYFRTFNQLICVACPK